MGYCFQTSNVIFNTLEFLSFMLKKIIRLQTDILLQCTLNMQLGCQLQNVFGNPQADYILYLILKGQLRQPECAMLGTPIHDSLKNEGMGLSQAGSEPFKPCEFRILERAFTSFCVKGNVLLEKHNFLFFSMKARFFNFQIMLIKFPRHQTGLASPYF